MGADLMVPVDVEVTPSVWDPRFVEVQPVWAGVDRPTVGGWSCSPKVAPRLVRALLAGAVYLSTEVKTDVYGQTYVSTASKVLGRTMNADLRRLGY